MRKFLVMISIVFIITTLVGFSSCKVVKHSELNKKGSKDEVTFYFESENFDAAAYVKENWDSRIVPEIQNSAISLSSLLKGLDNDFEETNIKYGIKKEDTSPYSFAVSETAVIKDIDTESSAGILTIDIHDLTADGFSKIQIGPVIKKSMIRDYLSFIKFGDFENQIEYANVSRELNFYIRDNILNKINDDYKIGATISFTGVFNFDKSGEILITPIEIELSEGAAE